ncbi:sigma-70 family RNA polymerase sigma factor [Actinosynnema sp. CS-041913]|uniref:sigma-70 family RNA polymerase sigma factor n=1 Tax=Actinosynnema sp. CS-041913 TaxID=3239917 RepID=UPI003D8CFFEF
MTRSDHDERWSGQTPGIPLATGFRVLDRWFWQRLSLRRKSDSQDLAGETLKRYAAERSREPGWEPVNLHAWLFAAADRVFKSYLAQREAPLAVDDQALAAATDELARREEALILHRFAAGTEDDVALRLDMQRLIRSLPQRDRRAVVAYAVDECTYAEIGTALGMSTTTAYRLIKRIAEDLQGSPLSAGYGPRSGGRRA